MASIHSISINNFAAYGLNRKRNFLKAPVCDCKEDAYLYLAELDDVKDWCIEVLSTYGCDEVAVFCVFKDGRYTAFVKQPDVEDEGLIYIHVKPTKAHDMFASLDAEFRLCCYGMITELEDGIWRVEE